MELEKTSSDGVLLHRFATLDDRSAFDEIVRRHRDRLMRICRRILNDPHASEDALQTVFFKLAERARLIRSFESLTEWLSTVAVNTALAAKSRGLKRQAREFDAVAKQPVAAPVLLEPRDDLRRSLEEELERLPEKYRRPLVLCYFEGETNEGAAVRLGCPKGSISTLLARGRELLRQRLVNRGITISGAALATLLLAGQACSSAAASGCVGLMAHQGFNAFFLAKIKAAWGGIAAATLVAGAAFMALRSAPEAQIPPRVPETLAAAQVEQNTPVPAPIARARHPSASALEVPELPDPIAGVEFRNTEPADGKMPSDRAAAPFWPAAEPRLPTPWEEPLKSRARWMLVSPASVSAVPPRIPSALVPDLPVSGHELQRQALEGTIVRAQQAMEGNPVGGSRLDKRRDSGDITAARATGASPEAIVQIAWDVESGLSAVRSSLDLAQGVVDQALQTVQQVLKVVHR